MHTFDQLSKLTDDVDDVVQCGTSLRGTVEDA